jgi:outer membrane protein assembly factor BamA
MPFYFMPTLGGNDTLRGFREYRFRGPHAILAQGEYRWEIWSGLDGALFYDAGKVADRREIWISRISRPITASDSASTPTTASSSASMPHSGAAMATICYIVFGGVF